MIIAIATILIIGVALFILSYYMNDRLEELENELEQISITSIQDTYQLKQKVKVLEEELLPGDMNPTTNSELREESWRTSKGVNHETYS